MSTKVGRNDPCPCGSGKKYKRCHLPLDNQRKHLVEEAAQGPEHSPQAFPSEPTIASLRGLVEKVPQAKRAKYKDLLAQTLEVAEYMELQEEIQAAVRALEAHREEFNKLLQDEQAYLNLVRMLFEDERFAPLRFTAEDIRRAFDHIGGPPNWSGRDEAAKSLHAAIVFVADKERRTQWAMNLMKHLPHYVKGGRFMEAWIIQCCALATMDLIAESNPFLYEMFCHGYEAWSNEKQARDEELLRDLGLDPGRLRSMNLVELNACVQKVDADPAKKGRLEAFLNTHPEHRNLALAGIEASIR
jgi:hypothetical protein